MGCDMEKIFVADSYKDAEIISEPFENEKGRSYVRIKMPCPRCGALGIIVSHVENGHPVPIPVDAGICYQCNGDKYITKTVRAYTEKEYQQNQKAKERAAARKEEKEKARQKDLIDNAAAYKHEVALKLGFGEDEKIYLVYGDSTYAIKDHLKEMGARFDPTFKWYFSKEVELPEGYYLCSFAFDELFDYHPAAKRADYKDNVPEIIRRKIAQLKGPSTSVYYPGEEKERLHNLTAVVAGIRGFEGYYGYTNVYKFTSGDYIFMWMTTKHLELNLGDVVDLTGTIKKFDEYMGEKLTYMTRCVVTKVGE
jgi:hypothetical protein